MIGISAIIGFGIAAAIEHWLVDGVDRHPVAVILWVLTGMVVLTIDPLVATGYFATIAASVLGEAYGEWLDNP